MATCRKCSSNRTESPMSLRSFGKQSARRVLHSWGGLNLIRYQHRGQLRILCYHRFSAMERTLAAEWEAHCRHIREAYSPISLDEAAVLLQNGDPLPKNAVVVTVDDGYRDFAQVAHPILRRYGIPATVYLIGNVLDQREWAWWDRVVYALAETRYAECTVGLSTGTVSLELPDAPSRWDAAVTLCEALKRVPNRERVQFVEQFLEQVGVSLPTQRPSFYETLTWDDVRVLSREGASFGAHTMSHPILPRVEEAWQVRAEILESKELLEDRLQCEAAHFCFPNGDFDERSSAAVREAKFRTAVTCREGFVDRTMGLLELNRISVDLEGSEFYFREGLAGLRRG